MKNVKKIFIFVVVLVFCFAGVSSSALAEAAATNDEGSASQALGVLVGVLGDVASEFVPGSGVVVDYAGEKILSAVFGEKTDATMKAIEDMQSKLDEMETHFTNLVKTQALKDQITSYDDTLSTVTHLYNTYGERLQQISGISDANQRKTEALRMFSSLSKEVAKIGDFHNSVLAMGDAIINKSSGKVTSSGCIFQVFDQVCVQDGYAWENQAYDDRENFRLSGLSVYTSLMSLDMLYEQYCYDVEQGKVKPVNGISTASNGDSSIYFNKMSEVTKQAKAINELAKKYPVNRRNDYRIFQVPGHQYTFKAEAWKTGRINRPGSRDDFLLKNSYYNYLCAVNDTSDGNGGHISMTDCLKDIAANSGGKSLYDVLFTDGNIPNPGVNGSCVFMPDTLSVWAENLSGTLSVMRIDTRGNTGQKDLITAQFTPWPFPQSWDSYSVGKMANTARLHLVQRGIIADPNYPAS